jgi:outer membrane protein OmpA-like peptidoglycan-associated protein
MSRKLIVSGLIAVAFLLVVLIVVVIHLSHQHTSESSLAVKNLEPSEPTFVPPKDAPAHRRPDGSPVLSLPPVGAQPPVRLSAESAEIPAAEAEKKQQLRQILDQLNDVLETRDTDHGLVVTIPDVLFGGDQYTLRPAAREKLAKLAGIVVARPGLKLVAEGRPWRQRGSRPISRDAQSNQRLCVKRAEAVTGYLRSQGIAAHTMSAPGLVDTLPEAPYVTAAGRRQDCRVELIVVLPEVPSNLAVSTGLTPDEVVAALGQPPKKVKTGIKEIYYYKDLKVTFVNGKVTDVE